jgi:hypothetical protein
MGLFLSGLGSGHGLVNFVAVGSSPLVGLDRHALDKVLRDGRAVLSLRALQDFHHDFAVPSDINLNFHGRFLSAK